LKPAIRLLLAGDIVVEAPHGFDAVELGVVLSLVKATFAPQSSGSKQ
jgi:hypothetical protein